MNFAQNIAIGLTERKGRGVFANSDLKEGDLIVVEEPIGKAQNPKNNVTVAITGK